MRTSSAVRQNPMLRALADTSPAQHVIQTARAARTVMPASRFIAGQALPASSGTYRLKASGAEVTVRHRSRDIAILAEIFARGSYAPPAACALGGSLTILDLGGNIGLFALYALATWDVASIRSYEPDPTNARLLASTAAAHARWTVTEAAVASEPGVMRFAAGMYSESREAEDGEPSITVPVLDVFAEPRAGLVKMDIEGGEWPILFDPRLKSLARVIVLEWHARGCPDPDAHATARRLLADAGYIRQHDAVHEHDGNGVVWAWKD